MKKSLIALAVLAASGGAMAQSSVTLYGLVDAYVGAASTETTGAAPVAKLTQTVVNSAGANNSRWGLRGTEDLGGGLKANFVLESGFATDTGAAVGNQFGRQAFVGLESAYGTVSLGRQYTAYFALYSATNNLYDTNMATTTAVWNNGIADHTTRASNSIAYTSPVFNGFSGAAVYGLGEDKIADRKAAYNGSLHLKYANGPLLVGYAYQQELSPTAAAGSRAKNQYNLFAGSYDFGVAKLTAGYSAAKATFSFPALPSIKDKEFQIGVSAPVGAAASVAAGYTRSKSTSAGTENTGSGFSLLGTYALSKRTTLYAGYRNTKVERLNGTVEDKSSALGLGVRHTF